MKKWAGRILLIVLTFVLVNDFGWYLRAMYTLDTYGRSAVREASRASRNDPAANSGWPTAFQIASEHGIEFVSYQQGPTGVTAVGLFYIDGTFLVGPVRAVLTGEPLNAPFPLEQSFHSNAE